MTDSSDKKSRFQPQMPQIPGVEDRAAAPLQPEPVAQPEPSATLPWQTPLVRKVRLAAGIIVVLLVILFFAWPKTKPVRQETQIALPSQPTTNSPEQSISNAPPSAVPGPVTIGALSDWAAPWSFKAFRFHKRDSSEPVEAIAVRLPGAAGNVQSYWAFSTEEPFGKCALEYVPDLGKLSSQYGYEAKNPMVASPCSGTLYDPSKVQAIGRGVWVRGEVAHGYGLRPPISIELRIKENQLVAVQIE